MSTLHPTLPEIHVAPRSVGALAEALRARGVAGSVLGPAEALVSDLTIDSRQAAPGVLFAAVSPDTTAGRDGHEFVDDALGRGAPGALVSEAWLAEQTGERLPGAAFLPATDTRAALAWAASEVYDHPAASLRLIGVTGTNGKTTTTFILHHLLTSLGQTAGLVGTVENRIGGERYATAFTTPEAPTLQRLLRAMVEGGCTAAAMEVSSHGLALDRVGALDFEVAVFTNLSHDHLDYHQTFEEYQAAKKCLFDGLGSDAVAIVNADDPASVRMTADSAARIVTFGTSPEADIRVEVLDNSLDGLLLRLDGDERRYHMLGRFNALNLAASYAVGVALGFDRADVLDALAQSPGVPGRFETVRLGGVLGVVDYAHTPDALDNVLATAREIVPAGNALWVVFGAGGDRDATKRPEMAAVAEARADRVVLTSDNPRSEDPEAILDAIAAGLTAPASATRLADRADAIAYAADHAEVGDVIVVAGKGHETYQIVGAERRDFDDRVVLRDALATREVQA